MPQFSDNMNRRNLFVNELEYWGVKKLRLDHIVNSTLPHKLIDHFKTPFSCKDITLIKWKELGPLSLSEIIDKNPIHHNEELKYTENDYYRGHVNE